MEIDFQIEMTNLTFSSSASSLILYLRTASDFSECTKLIFQFDSDLIVFDRSNSTLGNQSEIDTSNIVVPFSFHQNLLLPVQVFLDNSIVEIFVDQRVVISSRIYPLQVDSAVNIALQLLVPLEATEDETKIQEGESESVGISSFVIWNMQDLYEEQKYY